MCSFTDLDHSSIAARSLLVGSPFGVVNELRYVAKFAMKVLGVSLQRTLEKCELEQCWSNLRATI